MISPKYFVFRFSDVEVHEQELRATRGGQTLEIEPKAFRVLVYLIKHAGHLVSKSELMDAVWGETAVTDNSLTRAIALLRRVLEDDPRQPHFIETVSTAGYRFICPVEASEDTRGGMASPNSLLVGTSSEPAQINDGTASEAVSSDLPARTIWATRRGRLLAATFVGFGLIASAFWYLTRQLPTLRVTESTRIIHDSSSKFLGGTDGARLYFTDSMRFYAPGWNVPSMYQAATDGGTLEPLSVGPLHTWIEDVSPDGSALLVRSYDLHGKLGLWSVQVPGGALRHLVDTTHQYASWSPDGKSAIYWTDRLDIGIVQSDGTGAHILVPAKAFGEPSYGGRFAWSPNGKTIRFIKDRKLWEMSSDGSGIHLLLPDWLPSKGQGGGQWTPDGKFFVFDSYDIVSESWRNLVGPNQLWALDERHSLFRRAPTEPIRLTSGPIRWITPILSKDGKKIFARGLILDGQLERFDAQSHLLQPFLGGISAEFVSFSRDGQFVAYVTYPDGILWSANSDGSNRMQLTDPPLYPRCPRWSPDGTQILFMATDADGAFKALLVPSHDRSHPRPLLTEDKRVETDPNWSPDGHRVVLSMQAPGDPKSDIRILDLASHQVTILPGSAGLYSPRWSPNGRFVAAIESGSLVLKVFDFETQRWSLLHEGALYPEFSRDGQYIYFVFWGKDQGVYRVRPAGGKAEHVVELTDFRWAGSLSEWMGLDQTDAPLLLRNIGSDDIYALTLERK